MSFQPPQHVPNFDDSRRVQEDAYWRHKHTNGTQSAGIASKINDFMGEKELPMYKDKPHYPASRRRKSPMQRIGAVLALITLGLWWFGLVPGLGLGKGGETGGRTRSSNKEGAALWKERRDAVRGVFVTSWEGYEKHAWGMDEYHPVSRKGRNMVEGGMGWMIVDALDTAMMMNLTNQVGRAREWIATSLRHTADHDVSTFETTIRMLGGLLSAHYLSTTYPSLAPQRDDDVNQPGEDLYIEKATDLADRLLGAYDTTSGIPFASVNLNTSQGIPGGDFGVSSTAEAATLQLENKYLSKLMGEPIYWQKSEWILKVIDDQHQEDGLLPIFINPSTGRFSGSNIRLGSRGDSYYEYLIKQFLQTSGAEPVYLDLWNEALEGMKKHLITYTKHSSLTVLAERQSGLHQPLTAKMDHLVCFLPGTIALSVTNGSTVSEAESRLGASWTRKHDENLRVAEELMKTCWGMYLVTPTGLAPEIAYFNVDSPPRHWEAHIDDTWTPPESDDLIEDISAPWRDDYDIHANDVHNLQRPETVESLFYMYHITQNPIYREWGWKIFESFAEHTKLTDDLTGKIYSYTSLDTVMENPVKERRKRDNMESFWLAETLKYFWLLFTETSELDGMGADLEKTVVNTEGHFLPRFDISGSKVWKTGWERSGKKELKIEVTRSKEEYSGKEKVGLGAEEGAAGTSNLEATTESEGGT
jgi:endoplasmic reticulum Man9GlcNAc2 1,2-alpha-mannosidase